MRLIKNFVVGLWLVCTVGMAGEPRSAADAVITLERTGTISGVDHQKFRAIEFEVPEGIERIELDFAHDGRDVRTVVDLAVYDPERFRGASGSNKTSLSIGTVDATPSYLPGPIKAGVWRLVMGFPNVRAIIGLPGRGLPPTHYTVGIRLHRRDGRLAESAFLTAPVRAEAGWYRGDFHSHTAHSDGSCESRRGRRVPCPGFQTLLAADREQLDFIAVTDHNTHAHFNGLRELQAYFDNLLILPGMEMTTFGGHANILGISSWPAFLEPSADAARIAAVFAEARQRGGLVAINHPGLPSNEDCMGCGWSGQGGWGDVDAIEVVNGGSLLRFGSAEGPFSALEYWQKLLDRGLRLTAIAGSDSHDPLAARSQQVPVGRPRTVVFANELSPRAIFEGVRSGRAFVDVEGTATRHIDLRVVVGGRQFAMGSSMPAMPAGSNYKVIAEARDVSAQRIVITVGDAREARLTRTAVLDRPEVEIALKSTGCERWVRADVRDSAGNLVLISNPVYLDFDIKLQPRCKRSVGSE